MPKHYYCRKGFYVLNVQAVTDARKRFIFVAIMPGATRDARAYSFYALFAVINAGLISSGFYLIGDTAYRGLRQILTPFIGNLTAAESVFSFYHSSLRMVVECAFGIWACRWGILWRPLRVPLEKAPVVVESCMCLHNIMRLNLISSPYVISYSLYNQQHTVHYNESNRRSSHPHPLST